MFGALAVAALLAHTAHPLFWTGLLFALGLSALGITIFQEILVQPQPLGEVFISSIVYTTPNVAYVTGTGYTISARAFGLLSIRSVWGSPPVDSTKTYVIRPAITAKSGGVTTFTALIAVEATGAEYGGGAAVEGLIFRLTALGN